MSKPLHHQFEDELGELVDRYLSEGIDIEKMKSVLRHETGYDHQERKAELTPALTSPDGRGASNG